MDLQFGKTTYAAGFTTRLIDIGHRLAGDLAAYGGSLKNALEGHRAARRLAQLDDNILDDIGLSRGDVEQALFSPALSDPRADLAIARQYRINGRNRPIRRRR